MMIRTKTPGQRPSSEITAEEYAVVAAQEEFIVRSQVLIHRLLKKRGMSHADLAAALGVSEARVSQMFGDTAKNLTMRTIARIMHVLGETAVLTTESAASHRADQETVVAAPLEVSWLRMEAYSGAPFRRRSGKGRPTRATSQSGPRVGQSEGDESLMQMAA